ncbi:hypothetical protein PR048_032323 [Dryococelus australis]|uniref:Uncharacterized protein n=1 Tax=Dryococelus australis TaxID=614101 RepID=A0ABQ9G1Y7_9NEOP|nr:hypothetical protein PR048_032323 [Dryococelus australis]
MTSIQGPIGSQPASPCTRKIGTRSVSSSRAGCALHTNSCKKFSCKVGISRKFGARLASCETCFSGLRSSADTNLVEAAAAEHVTLCKAARGLVMHGVRMAVWGGEGGYSILDGTCPEESRAGRRRDIAAPGADTVGSRAEIFHGRLGARNLSLLHLKRSVNRRARGQEARDRYGRHGTLTPSALSPQRARSAVFPSRPCTLQIRSIVSEEIWAALNSEFLVAAQRDLSEYGAAPEWGWGKREIPEKTRRPTASSGTIPTCENSVTRSGIEPGEHPNRSATAAPLKLVYAVFLSDKRKVLRYGRSLICGFSSRVRDDGNTARLARRSDKALEARVSVARISLPRFLALDAQFHPTLNGQPTAIILWGPLWCFGQSARLPRRRTGFGFRWGRFWIIRTWESCPKMPLICGFSRGSPVFPALAFRRCSIPRFTLVDSQDLDIKSRPNLSTLHSLDCLIVTAYLRCDGACLTNHVASCPTGRASCSASVGEEGSCSPAHVQHLDHVTPAFEINLRKMTLPLPAYTVYQKVINWPPVYNVCSVVVTPLESRRATSCGYDSSHPVWHALYECLQDIHGDSSPFLLQELSNGFWSGLWAGQSNRRTFLSAHHCIVALETRRLALSSWKCGAESTSPDVRILRPGPATGGTSECVFAIGFTHADKWPKRPRVGCGVGVSARPAALFMLCPPSDLGRTVAMLILLISPLLECSSHTADMASGHNALLILPALQPVVPTIHFRTWESCRTMPLVGGFSRESPVSPCIPALLHTHLTSPLPTLRTRSLQFITAAACPPRTPSSFILAILDDPVNTARLARRSDEALGVRVSVARIAPSLLDLGRGVPSHSGLRIAPVPLAILISPILKAGDWRLACSPPTKAIRVQHNPRPVHSGFSHVGIVPDDAVGRRDFSGISSFPSPFIPALLHARLNHLHRLSSRPNIFTHTSTIM